ncbi:hypothetical protein BH10CHL1_BH10CHL1_39410 [soil metagenome]
MLSALRTRKFTSLFACFDFDKNEVLEKTDYEQFAKNLSQAYDLTPGSTEYAAMYAETMALWAFVQMVADQNGDNQVTKEEFITAYTALTNNEETFQQLLMSYAEYIIHMGDRDGNGKLDETEYATILWCYGITDVDARAAFRHLTANASNYLTNPEMEKIFAEFFCSDDPEAADNWMIGPL